jgi:hypothetical protein
MLDNSTTTSYVFPNTTTGVPNQDSELIGYISLVLSSVAWGAFYLPVKHYETGDGVFFQLVLCKAICISGLVVHWVRGLPSFGGIMPVLGGILWALGNASSVVIIKFLGIGLGSVLWNIVCLITGWAMCRYGLFDTIPQIPNNILLNYIGVFLTIISIFVFLFIKTETATFMIEERRPINVNESSITKKTYSTIEAKNNHNTQPHSNLSKLERLLDNLSLRWKRIIGVSLSLFAGTLMGFSYAPILYVKNNYPNASQDLNDYYFGYCVGALLGALLIFVIYAIYENNKPKVYPEIVVPGLLAGILMRFAMCFKAYLYIFQ